VSAVAASPGDGRGKEDRSRWNLPCLTRLSK
jgi:hypothetical protein